MEYFVPTVIEKVNGGERCYDIYSRLLRERIIFLGCELTDAVASSIIAQMLVLHSDDAKDEIKMYIMSPGGNINSAMAIYDTMQYLPNDVATYCVGEASSAGAFLLAAGSPGKRFSLQSARVMLHQPWGGAQGTATDISIQATEINRLKSMLYDRLVDHTGQDKKKIEADCERDFFMSAAEAKAYGIVDTVLEKFPSKRKPRR